MKKKLRTILILCFASIAAVFLLFILTTTWNHREGSFIRFFPPHVATELQTLNLGTNAYYIAGTYKEKLYLGNELVPSDLLHTNFELRDTMHGTIKFAAADATSSLQAFVTDSFLIASNFVSHRVLKGTLQTLQPAAWLADSGRIADGIPISSSSFIMKSIRRGLHRWDLQKKSQNTSFPVETPKLLEDQVDGIFSTDGMLNANAEGNLLVYVYYYRNQYICCDTNLHVLFKGKTIDTNTIAKIKLATIQSENKTTFAAPPFMVNKLSCISGHWLFVNSTIKSVNELTKNFQSSSTIDVYDLQNGKYKFSFYLPDYHQKKIRNFRVFNNRLFALYDRWLVEYSLQGIYFTSKS